MKKESANARQFCTFFLQGQCFGIPVEKVQEVIRHHEMTAVPLASPAIRGLMNLRGQIVLVLDLRRQLGLQPQSNDALPMNIVVRCESGTLSLLVDDIGDVVEIEESSFEPLPQTARANAQTMILGVHKLHNFLMHVLDTETVCRIVQASDVAPKEQGEPVCLT
jgi:purine-binding chemotaxis protein CheW